MFAAMEGASSMASAYIVEYLNHLGIIAEVCREIGAAIWLPRWIWIRQQYQMCGRPVR